MRVSSEYTSHSATSRCVPAGNCKGADLKCCRLGLSCLQKTSERQKVTRKKQHTDMHFRMESQRRRIVTPFRSSCCARDVRACASCTRETRECIVSSTFENLCHSLLSATACCVVLFWLGCEERHPEDVAEIDQGDMSKLFA